MDALRTANGAGFWGDNLDAPVRLAESGQVDVLTLEYLAELTLAILAHQRSRRPEAGYVHDLPPLLRRIRSAVEGGLRIVTNGGGLNVTACAAACAAELDPMTPIGVVTGDDVLADLPTWLVEGVRLDHLETGAPLTDVADRLVCANVYLGARPIAEALSQGAQVVLTGRVADASLALGPAAAYHGWSWDDYDTLASASVAGHLIECGAQVTGGLWHNWAEIEDLAGVGYPIAEVARDGSSVITKPEPSGGLVTVANVAEQLVYEIEDPSCYRTPDVDVDLTGVVLTQAGRNRVAVSRTVGRAPAPFLKLSAIYRDGWTASGWLAVVGRDAEAKARACGAIVLERVRRAGFELAETCVEVLGAGDVVRGLVRPSEPPYEVLLRMTVRDPRREAVERFCRELAPLITSGPAGLAGYAGGRPEARPAYGYWPALVPRERVTAGVEVRSARDWKAGGP
ncbi:MAG: hypothetical protein KatS3mg108_2280 [Isosphaeraceae bacterium]|nr:MAG: hypothetical protein KatS3mg108_2280 [Isosphaeraceae bacterium]